MKRFVLKSFVRFVRAYRTTAQGVARDQTNTNSATRANSNTTDEQCSIHRFTICYRLDVGQRLEHERVMSYGSFDDAEPAECCQPLPATLRCLLDTMIAIKAQVDMRGTSCCGATR